MKIITNQAGREIPAAEAFTPDVGPYDYTGSLERAEARASLACESMGRLLAILYHRGDLTFEEARTISGQWGYQEQDL